MFKKIAGVGLLGAAAVTIPLAVEAANAAPRQFVALRNVPQASKILDHFGKKSLFALDTSKKLRSLEHYELRHHKKTLYAPLADAQRALGTAVASSLRKVPAAFLPGAAHANAPTAETTPTTVPSVTTTTADPPPTTTAPAAVGTTAAPAAAPATQVGSVGPSIASGPVLFDDTFSTLSSSYWNTFVTSKAANGYPWNSNGTGGSGPDNPSQNYDAEYDLPSQVTIAGEGLALTATNQPIEGVLGSYPNLYPWRSGTVSSYNHFQFNGGTLEITAKMPAGNGMWPGLWMLPGPGGTGGDNAEIDLFEGGYAAGGASPNDVFAWHLHSSSGVVGGQINTGVDLTAGFHTYGLKWVPGSSLTWYLDGRQLAQVTSSQANIPNEPMEIIMNVQVATSATSGWHTVPDSSTPSSSTMYVREVKVSAG